MRRGVGEYVGGGATVTGETSAPALGNACCLAISYYKLRISRGRIALVPVKLEMLMTDLEACRLLTGQAITVTYLRKHLE